MKYPKHFDLPIKFYLEFLKRQLKKLGHPASEIEYTALVDYSFIAMRKYMRIFMYAENK